MLPYSLIFFRQKRQSLRNTSVSNSSKINYQEDGIIQKEVRKHCRSFQRSLTLYRYAKECVLMFWNVMSGA